MTTRILSLCDNVPFKVILVGRLPSRTTNGAECRAMVGQSRLGHTAIMEANWLGEQTFGGKKASKRANEPTNAYSYINIYIRVSV